MSFDAGTVTSELTLDRSPFIRSLHAARMEAADFARKSYRATLGADTGEATRDILGVRQEGRDFANERYEATVDVDDRPGRRKLNGFDDVLQRYSRSWGQQGVRARVTADIQRALRSIRLLEAELEETTDERRRVYIEAETLRARQRLEGLQNLARRLGAQDPTVSVNVRGVAASAAAMIGLTRIADRLDGYNIRMRADVDSSLSRALPSALGALEMQVARVKTVMTAIAAVTMPIFYTALGALPGILAAGTGAVSSLAISIGKGLTGAAGAGTAALILGGSAVLGYGAAVSRTINYVKNLSDVLEDQYRNLDATADVVKTAKLRVNAAEKGTREYTNAVKAHRLALLNQQQQQEKMNTLFDIMTPRVLRLQKATHRARISLLEMGGGIMNAVAPALLLGLSRFNDFSDSLNSGATKMARNMDAVSQSLIRTATSGQQLKSITRVLNGIKQAGPPTLRLLGNTALFAVNMLSPLVPYGLRLLKTMNRLSGAARRWSASVEGQRAMGNVWADLWRRANRLWGISKDLALGLWGVARALDATGTGDYILRHLASVARNFRHIMREGGRGRQAVMKFMNDARPALSEGGKLVRELWRGFWRLAGALFGVTSKSSKLDILADSIRAVRKSIQPLVGFLIHELESVGPKLPKLIENTAEWFRVFARSQPEMLAFIDGLNAVLSAFNKLPEEQRIAIARTAAWMTVVKQLGGGALVGLIGSMAQTLFLSRQINKVQARLPGKFDSTAKSARSLRGILLKLAGLAIVITVVATFDYSGAAKARKKARKIGQGHGLAMTKGFLAGMKSVPLVGPIAGWFEKKINKGLGKRDRFKGKGKGIGGGIKTGIFEGLAGLAGGMAPIMKVVLNDILKWWGIKSPSTKAKNRIGKPIAAGILGGLKNGGLIGGAIAFMAQFFKKTSGKSKGQRWKSIGDTAAGRILDGLKNGGLIGGALAFINEFFGKSSGRSKSKNWNSIGDSSAGRILSGFKNGGLLGGAVAFMGQFFNSSSGSAKNKPWTGVGSGPAGRILSGFKNGGLLGGAVGFMGSVFVAINNKSRDGSAKTSGKNIVQGLLNGIWSKSGALYDAARKLVGNFLKAIRNRGKEGSPWRTTFESGRFAGDGLVQGLLARQNAVREAARRLADAARYGASTHLDGPSLGASRLSGSAVRGSRTVTNYNSGGVRAEMPFTINVGSDLDAAERRAIQTVKRAFRQIKSSGIYDTQLTGGNV